MKRIFLLLFVCIFIASNTYSQCETNDLIYPPNTSQTGIYKTSAKIESAGEISNHTTFMANDRITLKSGFSVAQNATFFANNLSCVESSETSTIQENTTFEEDQIALQQLLSIIETTAESVSCTNANDWTFTPIGSKACGGPLSYIAYSTQINVTTFLYDVERYTTATNDFNIKWGIISTCELLLPPSDVICNNNKAELVYGVLPIIGENTTYEEDAEALQQLLSNIETTAESVPCTNANDWAFTPIGSKPCGGPSSYIAYSTLINEASFLNNVQEYTAATNDFNIKWGIISTCEVTPAPSGVVCNNNEAILVYGEIPIIGENTTYEEDIEALQELLSSIETIAESVPCTNANDWAFTPIGSKPCGGPSSYIAYPTQINEASFLNDVQEYTAATNDFNIKWGIISTCEVTPAPSGVVCNNNEAVLVYGEGPVIGENTTYEEDVAALQQLLSNIEAIAESVSCTNANNWSFTAIGSKPCGGPSSYIAYPTQINVASFLSDVQLYTNATQDFNTKWGIFSTCEVTPAPNSVSCVGGEAILNY